MITSPCHLYSRTLFHVGNTCRLLSAGIHGEALHRVECQNRSSKVELQKIADNVLSRCGCYRQLIRYL